MKKILVSLVMVVMLVFAFLYSVYASSLDDAKGLAEKAAVYVKANGKEKGLAEIRNPKGQFVKGDLYVVAADFNGVSLANPMQPKLQGINLLDVKDGSGKPFMKEVVDVARTKGSGWVTYSWTNPATKKLQSKKSWVQRVEGQDIWLMCGIFQ